MYENLSWMQHHKLEVDGCATWYVGNGLSETKNQSVFDLV